MTEREKALEDSVKELGRWVSHLSCAGRFNPAIAKALQNGRDALIMKEDGDD